MKGDFSRRFEHPVDNLAGVLWQQGRVLTDSDGNEVTLLNKAWQETAGRDIVGPGVAAVPTGEPASFQVLSAAISGGQVQATLGAGRIWADGWLLQLEEAAPITRTAGYLPPPIGAAGDAVGGIGSGTRDLVVLETWREALNAFQVPDELIEPALGGPDTTERLLTAWRLRMLRLGPGETCETAAGRLGDDLAGLGRLTATLNPPTVVAGDCPVADAGGYSGFEHRLFRAEIAETDGPGTFFKWSDQNGGLVGRGRFDAAAGRASITANLAPIASSGRNAFYLEVVRYDEAAGQWRVTYGAPVTLDSDNELVLPGTPTFGAVPPANRRVFFRLWNGLENLADFGLGGGPGGGPAELLDGIRLAFSAGGSYRPGDYWVFQVRAGEISNPETLVDDERPQGIAFRRVPLGILEWDGSGSVSAASGTIHDCRRRFPPLTRIETCCTYRVGDGLVSHGDFDSIQEAIDALPAQGGQVCVLPGDHRGPVVIEDRVDVTLHGCGPLSRVFGVPGAGEFAEAEPAIAIRDSRRVKIEGLSIEAHESGIGLLVESSSLLTKKETPAFAARNITLQDLEILAGPRCAIEVREALDVTIRRNDLLLRDAPTSWPGLFFLGEEALIEHNVIRVKPRQQGASTSGAPLAAGAALGGLQIAGLSVAVRVVDNLIQGGIGNGITLGSLAEVAEDGINLKKLVGWVTNADDPCFPCKPGDTQLPDPKDGGDGGSRLEPAGPLEEIRIERNRILDMGLNGIGVIGFFDLSGVDAMISVLGLEILGNRIQRCLRRPLAPIPESLRDAMGYGGIALADVERLVVRDNAIEDNGPDHLQPVNGIFVLHGEGIEINGNRILNNGAKTGEPTKAAQAGRRGGITIVYGVAPTLPTVIGQGLFPRQSGEPAILIQGNQVSQPLGRALTAAAFGPVLVQGNALTSRGMVLRSQGLDDTFLASAVMILNLGVSNELYGQLLLFALMNQGQVKSGAKTSLKEDAVLTIERVSRPGLDDLAIGQYLANGNVSFTGNQVTLDLLEKGLSLTLSSTVILTLDDLLFADNQCDAALLDDFLLTQALLFGFSLRVADNRFKEGIFNALFSAVTLGLMNTTCDNQATHCLLVRPQPPNPFVVRRDNIIVINGLLEGFCEKLQGLLAGFGKKGQAATQPVDGS